MGSLSMWGRGGAFSAGEEESQGSWRHMEGTGATLSEEIPLQLMGGSLPSVSGNTVVQVTGWILAGQLYKDLVCNQW